MTLGLSLIVDRSDIEHIASRPLLLSDESTPPEGSVLLGVERFGFTANNLTYATFGEALGYWSFFPAPDGFGHIPVWGRATVIGSGHPDVSEGTTYYGFMPMATHLLVAPTDTGRRGFTDGSPHRTAGAAVYNRYLDVAVDPFSAASPSPELEVLLRPLFTTSFLLDAELADAAWYGADAVVLTSASSRTALGVAHLLRSRDAGPAVVGITSPEHVADTESSDCYDRVLDYDDVARLPPGRTLVVDLSGDGSVVEDLHRHLGSHNVHSAIVGATHRNAPPVDTANLPGPEREIFFAPHAAEALRDRVGVEAVEAALIEAWSGFAAVMSDWLRVRTAKGVTRVCAAYRDVLDGARTPRDGWVMTLRDHA